MHFYSKNVYAVFSTYKIDPQKSFPNDGDSLAGRDVTVLPSRIGIGGVAPGPLFVVSSPAVISLVTQCAL